MRVEQPAERLLAVLDREAVRLDHGRAFVADMGGEGAPEPAQTVLPGRDVLLPGDMRDPAVAERGEVAHRHLHRQGVVDPGRGNVGLLGVAIDSDHRDTRLAPERGQRITDAQRGEDQPVGAARDEPIDAAAPRARGRCLCSRSG